jgi:hypothetical protein
VAVDPRTDVPDKGIIGALWIGLLVPPTAFLINLEVAYALVPTACGTRSVLLVHLVHLASLALAVYGGVVAWRTWRRSGATWPGGNGGRISRTQFMAGIGALTGLMFAVVIVAQWIPSFILDPCQ